MRPLEESEIQQVFEKLFKFVGKNLKNIVDRADQPHCFRLHKKVRRLRRVSTHELPEEALRAHEPGFASKRKPR
jgi:ribosome biogenesis protein Nip4